MNGEGRMIVTYRMRVEIVEHQNRKTLFVYSRKLGPCTERP